MKYLTILAVSILVGCSSFNWYKEPIEGAVAQITIKTLDDGYHKNMPITLFEGEEYLETKGKTIGVFNSWMPGIKNVKSLSIKVRAGAEFRFLIRLGDIVASDFNINRVSLQGTVCQVHTGFIPESNREYMAIHKYENSVCTVDLLERSIDGSYRPVTTQKIYRSCLDPKLSGLGFKEYFCPEIGFQFRN